MARKMFITVILDESGSMSGCRGATISGFNEYLNEQRKKAAEEGNIALFSLTKFNTECIPVCLATPISDAPELTEQTYEPSGMTALYDAIGCTLKNLETDLQRETEKPGVLVVVITDGQNNSSKEYTQDAIVKLIESKKKEGNFTFVFLGADIDVWEGQTLGFDAGNSIKYGKANSVQAFKAMSVSTSNLAGKVYGASVGASDLSMNDYVSGAAEAWDAAVQPDDAEAAADALVGCDFTTTDMGNHDA